MASKKVKGYQVEFSIDGLSLLEQEKIYQQVVAILDYNQRGKLHITITDPIGGKHYVWDGSGETPEHFFCKKCHEFSCDRCKTYSRLGDIDKLQKVFEKVELKNKALKT